LVLHIRMSESLDLHSISSFSPETARHSIGLRTVSRKVHGVRISVEHD
jgi:hypothetical protein